MATFGLPYTGSKRKLAKKIADTIIFQNPNVKYVYDLFGGGGAVTFEFLRRGVNVVYNDLDTGITCLLKKLLSNDTIDLYQWVDRETYHKHKYDKTWFGGFLHTVWSFGGNGQGYLYDKKIEDKKHKIHNEIMFLASKMCISINDARLLYKKQYFGRVEYLERVQHLENIRHLERIQRFPITDKLTIFNQSYDEVVVNTPINETVIYLDPPYKDTAKYNYGIDYDALYKYIRESPYKVYLSSYEAPFECIAEFQHRSILSATNNSKKVVEKLFTNNAE